MPAWLFKYDHGIQYQLGKYYNAERIDKISLVGKFVGKWE
jgi:hypothetical protein